MFLPASVNRRVGNSADPRIRLFHRDIWVKKKQTVRGIVILFLHPHDRSSCRYASAQSDYGHSHGVIGRTLMETAGEHVAILYNSADGRFVCVMLLATLSFPKRNAAHSDHFA